MIKKGLIFMLLFIMLAKFCHKQTSGFAVTKISHHLLQEADAPLKVSGTYRYLAKGGQAYVFVSEDGTQVLKLFRTSRLNALELLTACLPHPKLKKALLREKAKCEQTLQSYRLAYQRLPHQTGLVAVHLGENSPVEGSLQIIDKLGISHIIDPQKTPFVIQERAVLVKEALNQLIATQGVDGAKQALRQLLMMIKERYDLGIEDHDPNLAKNFGFKEGGPIEIDAGRFEWGPKPTLIKLQHSKEDLQHWINAHHPALSDIFDSQYQEIFSDPL